MALVALTFAVYVPVLRADFVWDDDVHIWRNPNLADTSGLFNIWLRPSSNIQYYPLTFTAFWIQHKFWGSTATGYHAINVALHAACAVLLWLLLRRLDVRGGWTAAAAFAVHPVLVESVAWCTELKNVLSCALYLLCLLAYFRAHPLPGAPVPEPRARRNWYTAALALFAAGLLAKPAAVALPLVILVLVWWKRGTVGKEDAVRVVPMLAMSLAMGLVTIYAETEFSAAGWDASPVERVLVAGRALVFYASKIVWPVGLCSIYPRWEVSASVWWQVLFPLAGAGVVTALWLWRRTLGRGPVTGALSYALLLAPVLGFVDVAYFRYAFVADHLQYHAAPALITSLVAAATLAGTSAGARSASSRFTVAAGALVLLLGTLAWRHAAVFADEKARCTDTIAKNPGAWVAMQSLAIIEMGAGRSQEAIRLYERALRVKPDYADAHNNLGVALESTGQRAAALRAYREALRFSPDHPYAHENLGRNLETDGRLDEAIGHLGAALRQRPHSAAARASLGTALAKQGRYDEAIDQLRQALALDPDNTTARRALARAVTLKSGDAAPAGR